MFDNRDNLDQYTWGEAIHEGVLLDVTELARKAGFRFPVALSAAAYAKAVAVPDGVVRQDISGRLWDVLNILMAAIRRGLCGGEVMFHVHVRNVKLPAAFQAIQLRAVCGPGDRGEPCITVMLPGEN